MGKEDDLVAMVCDPLGDLHGLSNLTEVVYQRGIIKRLEEKP